MNERDFRRAEIKARLAIQAATIKAYLDFNKEFAKRCHAQDAAKRAIRETRLHNAQWRVRLRAWWLRLLVRFSCL